jgi:hypothetical protein
MAPLPSGENSWYALNRMLDEPKSRPRIFGEENLTPVGTEPYSLVSIAPTLYKLSLILMTACNENHNCAVCMSGAWVPSQIVPHFYSDPANLEVSLLGYRVRIAGGYRLNQPGFLSNGILG